MSKSKLWSQMRNAAVVGISLALNVAFVAPVSALPKGGPGIPQHCKTIRRCERKCHNEWRPKYVYAGPITHVRVCRRTCHRQRQCAPSP